MTGDPSKIIQAVKLSVSPRLAIAGEFSGRFWQSRFYDFNLWGHQKEVEKLKYMHRNPVVRGLVASPEDWRWSSYRSYAYGEAGLVRINDWTWWEEKIRRRVGRVSAKAPLLAKDARNGAPSAFSKDARAPVVLPRLRYIGQLIANDAKISRYTLV